VIDLYRTLTCGELRKTDNGKQVILSGWVSKLRVYGNLIFKVIRDRYGVTQVTVPKDIISLKKDPNSIKIAPIISQFCDKTIEL